MTDASSAAQKLKLQAWFETWRSCLQEVLARAPAQSTVFELEAGPLHEPATDLRYTVTASGAVQGEMAVRLTSISAVRLARQFRGDGEPDNNAFVSESGTIADDDREALETVLGRVAELVSRAIASSAGGEVHLQVTNADAVWAETADAIASLRCRQEGVPDTAIEIRVSPALATALGKLATIPAQEPLFPATGASEAASHADSYRRLLDVGLEVKLRFGTRRMLLREVLALSAGAVVELDCAPGSPVDLLLDGRIIARGDVVVVDSMYGLRVTEVVDSSSRRPARQ